MGILDIVLLLCFVPAIVQGIMKGFVQQVISLVAILVGAWLAFRFSSLIAGWLSAYFTLDPKILNVAAFAIIVILAVLLIYWLGQLITKVIKIATLGWLNRVLGVIFAIAKTALILGLLVMVFESVNGKFGLVKPGKLDDSGVYCLLRNFANSVFPYLKSLVSGGNA